MKNPANVKYFKAGVTGVCVAAVCLIMTFVIFNMSQVITLFSAIGRILTPFM